MRFASVFIRTTDRNSSFQQFTKLKMNAAMIPGVITGTSTRNRAPKREHPSIIAASSRASGTFSKNPRSMTVENGMQTAMYTRIRPGFVSTRPRSVIIEYSGPSAMNAGIIWVSRNATSTVPLPRNSNRAIT